MPYLGHTSEDGREQTLASHLAGTAQRAEQFAEAFGVGEWGRLLGSCHDIGKYSAAFQHRLRYNGPKVDHATAGGQVVRALTQSHLLAYPIVGHHGGLPDGGSPSDAPGTGTLFGRLAKTPPDIPDYSAYQNEMTPQLPTAGLPTRPLGGYGFSMSMLLRMLFSCLVDADYLDTEHFAQNGQVQRGGYDDIPALSDRLARYIQRFGKATTPINEKRNEILADCLRAASLEKGLFSLTVPTGGGKTIASLAFALAHAKQKGLNRVIYAIPYSSIIEQNAAVFADILGAENVLEHHSNIDYENDENGLNQRKYLSTQNWDAPVVVTSNVQFFESFFATRTSKCRKLHNVAGSVIILDEAQTIPLPYLQPCVRVLAELVHNFGCSVVLCSATQPALEAFFPPEVPCKEIVRAPEQLYEFFRRVTLRPLGPLTDDELATRLAGQRQVLCIVNTRKQAQALFSLLPAEGSFHLSTTLYPQHRKQVLTEIRQRLKQGLACRVVSTSLVEAGVDVDFPVVYRATAGLDSIIQAAGRCNREGKHTAEESPVYIFVPDEQYKTPLSQSMPIGAYEQVAQMHDDLASLASVKSYFSLLYTLRGATLDQKSIVSRLEDGYKAGYSFAFKAIEEDFTLIDSNTRAVLIPDTPEAAKLEARLRFGERNSRLLADVGRYSVNVYAHSYRELLSLGVIEPIDDQIAVLAMQDYYDPSTGLALNPMGGRALFVDI